MITIAVCDTCTLIQLTKGGILHCLNKLFDEVYIPKAVELECKDQETMAEVKKLGFKVSTVSRILPIGLGRGERECISLVSELGPQTVFVTDDEKAIKKAQNEGLTVFETSSIIILAKYTGLIPSVKTVLDTMRAKGEGIEDKVYLRILQETGEVA